MMRIGLIGCGHIGTVHSFALRQLIDAGLVDARTHRDLRRSTRSGRRASPSHHGGDGVAPTSTRCSTRSTSCGSAPGPPAHLAAVEARRRPRSPVFCEKPLAPTLADCQRVAALLEPVPHQVGLVLRHAPVFATWPRSSRRAGTAGRWRASCATTSTSRSRACTARRGAATSRRRAAARSSSTRSTTSTSSLGARGPRVGRRAHTASIFGHAGIEDVAAVTLTYADGAIARSSSVWHQVLDPPVDPPASRCSARTRSLDRRRLPRAAARRDLRRGRGDRGRPAARVGRPLDGPEVLPSRCAQYAEPSKAFLDALAARRTDGGRRARRRGRPGRPPARGRGRTASAARGWRAGAARAER